MWKNWRVLGASAEELRVALEEIQLKLSLSNLDGFINDAILSSIKIIEGYNPL